MSIREQMREPQYQVCLNVRDERGIARLGLMTNQAWQQDPRHLLFMLSRYKFVSKMLSGRTSVLEVGCADAFGTRLVQQEVGDLTAVDFDPVFVKDSIERMSPDWRFTCRVHDILEGPVSGRFDAAYSMDVLEHIPVQHERTFVANIVASLTEDGVLLVGSPSIHSQTFASPPSREGHVNCKDAAGMKRLMSEVFYNVFIFSMNDDVVHTGFTPMSNYLLAL